MKKINLKGISEILSEKEMKNTVGGGNLRQSINVAPDDAGGGGSSTKIEPCPGPYGCNSLGAHINGGICCPLPCNGIFSAYGGAIVSGVSSCPW